MKSFRDNIYDILAHHNPSVARLWRQSYVAPQAYASLGVEFKAVADYFFNAFSIIPGDQTRYLNAIVGNSANIQHWLMDFRDAVAPAFVANAHFVFDPQQQSTAPTDFGLLLGTY